MRRVSHWGRMVPLALLAAFAASGCTDQRIVYRDRALFEQPASTSGDFLGYADTLSQLTTCGNCHVEKQTRWLATKHASAWKDLQASDHASSSCEGCHSVDQNGNPDTTAVGYEATGEPRYHDVQCESCHGPGLKHASSPTQFNVPLAPADVNLTTGCGECHQGHNAQTDEWLKSMHAEPNPHAQDHGQPCVGCHTASGALEAFGVKTQFLEQDSVANGAHLQLTCVVCHDPHGSDNEYQLRYPMSSNTLEGNLCMRCHQREGTPDLTSKYGPHSPEGPTLIGTAGWWPQGTKPATPIVGTHGNVDANPGTCATCHMPSFKGTNGQNYSGHTFEAAPCVDSLGLPLGTGSTCDDTQRDFDACATSGCHGSGDVARNLYEVATKRIGDLATEVNAMVAQVPADQFSTTDAVETVGEGAKFNAQLASMGGAAIHNPFLMEALLTASVKALEDTYGIQPVMNVSLAPQFKAASGH